MITRDVTQAEEEIFNTLTNHILWGNADTRDDPRQDHLTCEIAGVEIEWRWTLRYNSIKTTTWVSILGTRSAGLTQGVRRTITYKDADRLSVDLVSLKLALV